MTPIITLTTDFGIGSPYVAEMKGVILSINPGARLIDVTHAVPSRDVRQAAIVLARTTPLFPPDSIHVAVVDPGVGTKRKILYARIGDQQYVAPDNGCLSGLAARRHPSTMIAIAERKYWRPAVSPTFHGRDIVAPVAARLSLGLSPALLGPEQTELVQLDWPEARVVANKIEGQIVSVDSFGNLMTNITEAVLAEIPDRAQAQVRCDEHETLGIFNTYADQPPMTLIALVGSAGQLELAIVEESAKMMLGVGVGEMVTVTW